MIIVFSLHLGASIVLWGLQGISAVLFMYYQAKYVRFTATWLIARGNKDLLNRKMLF